ncbi:LysM and putative peptidoglycan-binding domain-containing protein 4, partial [Cucurbita argyrosperma subsp. sororia]
MERGRMNGNGICDYSYEGNGFHALDLVDVYGGESTPNGRSSGKTSQGSSPTSCILHPVSKLDTLAGVAIKYGVEVADIRKMNGLVTDFQMFALKSLQIPLPGRHPPSPCLLEELSTPGQSSSERTPSARLSSDFFESFQSLKLKSSEQRISSAMSSLQGYYGLKPSDQRSRINGFDTAVYSEGASHDSEDMLVSGTSQDLDLLMPHHRKSRSSVNGFLGEKVEVADLQSAEAGGDGDPKWNDKLVRRRQKSVADFSHSPEMLLKDDNSSGSNGFSSSAGKGLLAQRPKTSSRTNLATDNAVGLIPIPIGLGDSYVAVDGFAGVRKSLSTSSLPDPENGNTSSIWSASKWSLKPDLQAISTASGLPKPLTGRRNKAALD